MPAIFELDAGPYRMGELGVRELRGREELSKPYSYSIEVAAKGVDELTLESALLGQRATLRMHFGEGSGRAVSGLIASVRQEGIYPADHASHFRMRLVPRLWILKKKRNTRIFQDKKVDAIVDYVLDASKIDRSWKLLRKYPVRAYCVQYQETDYDFIARILAEEGIVYYFEQPSLSETLAAVAGALGGAAVGAAVGAVAGALSSAFGPPEKMVFIDGQESYPAIASTSLLETNFSSVVALAGASAVTAAASELGITVGGSPAVHFRDAEGMRPADEHVFHFALERSIASKSAFLRDYDFRRPALDLSAKADMQSGAPSSGSIPVAADISGSLGVSLGASGPSVTGSLAATFRPDLGAWVDPEALEVYTHHGEYEEPDVDPAEAKLYLEQVRARALLGSGQSFCPRLTAGHRFCLEDHAVHSLNREYVVTRVDHVGYVPETGVAGENVAERRAYENRFVCVPSSVAFRPKRPRRVHKQVLETAIVVGDDEISTDQFGRVRVRFHWDREETSSCWMRVAQVWAGASWGAQFIPRLGMEVLVSFLGGDQDRPMVIGCVYNGEHPPSFALPQEKTKSGFRTSSVPGGHGFNELSFEDRKDSEEIFVRAQKDYTELVQNDRTATVKRDDALKVERNLGVVVLGDHEARIGGESKLAVASKREETVGNDDSLTVSGARTVSVGKDAIANAGGDTKITSGGSLVVTLGGGESKHIAHDQVVEVARDATLRVGGAHYVSVGSEGDDGDVGGSGLSVKGDVFTEATGAIRLSAKKGLSLEVGGCSVQISEDGIKLTLKDSVLEITKDDIYASSKKVNLLGSEEVSFKADGAFFKLTKDAEAAGEKVKLFSDGAALELTTTAKLDGSQVKINAGKSQKSSGPEKKESKKKDPKPHKLRLVAKDEKGSPLGGKSYVLTVDGKAFPKGTTGGDGLIEQEIDERAQSGSILLDVSDEKKLLIPLEINRLPPIDEVGGVKARLRNLGFFFGPIDDVIDGKTLQAIRDFQKKNELEVTGRLDGDTRSKLESLHDKP